MAKARCATGTIPTSVARTNAQWATSAGRTRRDAQAAASNAPVPITNRPLDDVIHDLGAASAGSSFSSGALSVSEPSVAPGNAPSGRTKPPLGFSGRAPLGAIPKPTPRTAFSMCSGGVCVSSSVNRNRSAIRATSTRSTPGRRSTAPRTLAAHDPQSMPVTRHSRCCALVFAMKALRRDSSTEP